MRKGFLNQYHIGDARSISEFFPSEEFVDVTITSPPYWNLKNYGSRQQVGFGQTYESYLDDLEQVFTSIYRVTKRTGSLWVVADTIKHKGELKLFPFDLADRLKKIGWIHHDIIIWNKDKTLPWSHRGKLRNIFEYILFFSKGKKFKYYLSRVREIEELRKWWVRYPERYSPQGKAPTRTWTIKIPRQGSWGENWVRHFCPFPPKLVRRILSLTTTEGDVVFDPFAGSGVVLAQAKAMQRKHVGLDLRKSYRQMFHRRVLPSITAQENGNLGLRSQEEGRRKSFARLIWRLRKTKYPRELLRLYEKEFSKTNAAGIIAFSDALRSLKIILLFSEPRRIPRKFLSRLQPIVRRPPLSKYGLKVNVSIALLGDHHKETLRANGINPRTKLSLYKNGRTYQSAGEVSVRDFLESLKNAEGQTFKGIPVIASNVQVRIPKKMLTQSRP